MYHTSNSHYGWNCVPGTSDDALKTVEKYEAATRSQRVHCDEETKRLNATFWKSTNQESYVSSVEKKTALAKAADSLATAKATKHVGKRKPRVVPIPTEKKFVEGVIGQHWEHTTKPENLIYTTSANDIGRKKPNPLTDGPDRIYPVSSEFTSTFTGGARRDCGLNTMLSKSRYVDM